jgi:hypothetical protein
MIGVPSHVVTAVDAGSGLGFLGRADAVAAVPRRTTAQVKAAIRDNGRLIRLY